LAGKQLLSRCGVMNGHYRVIVRSLLSDVDVAANVHENKKNKKNEKTRIVFIAIHVTRPKLLKLPLV